MREAVAHRPPSSDPFTDLLFMLWGVVVSWMQLDLATLNEGVGAAVGVLTIILLLYRIGLAHIELTDEKEAET